MDNNLHLVMFDVDGTLVNSASFDETSYLSAVESVTGLRISSDWASYVHATDAGILEEAIDRYDIPGERHRIHRDVRKAFIDRIAGCIGSHPFHIREIEGAASFIRYLSLERNCRVAIATGGWEETARLKLEAAGINIEGCAFASSSDHHSRVGIMEIAESRSVSDFPFKTKTYFGDALWDKEASETLNYNFVLVGSKIEYKNRIKDFKDRASIMKILNL